MTALACFVLQSLLLEGEPRAEPAVGMRDDPAQVARQLRKFRREGHLDEALALAEKQPVAVASDARVRGEHALALLADERPEQAAQLVAGHAGRGPVALPLAIAMTHLQFLEGDLDAARANLALMLKDMPEHVDLLVLSIRLALRDGDYAAGTRALEQARSDLNAALAAELEVALLRSRAMEMMASDELLERAVPLLERAHELLPERVDVTSLLVRGLARFQRAERAQALAEAALAEAEGAARVELLYALGFVRRAQLRDDEAKACFEQVLALQPDHDQAQVGLARCELARGDLDAASAQVAACLQADAENLDALVLLSEIEGENLRWDAAAAALERLLEIKPRHLRGLWLLSRVRARQGMRDEVTALVQRYEARKAQLEQGVDPGER